MNLHHRNRLQQFQQDQGFSLVEVLVSLVVLAVGLLGIAKLQALAYSSTSSSSKRSLVAMEASSLAASMRTNRLFWSTATATAVTISISAGAATITSVPTSSGLATAIDCTPSGAAPCTTAQMAAYDVNQWAVDVSTLLPNSTTTIACPNLPLPVVCTIKVAWNEKTVGINKNIVTSSQPDTTLLLYVEP
jgi:type IV pilus assembly protein PilV